MLLAVLIPTWDSYSLAFYIMYSAYKLNKQGDNIQPFCTPFPILNQSIVPCRVLTIAFWPTYRFLKRQVRWSGVLISLRIFHSLLWSTQSKALVWSISRNFFWNSLAFSVIHWMLANGPLVPLPFLNPACTSRSSRFTYFWSLPWRILSIIYVCIYIYIYIHIYIYSQIILYITYIYNDKILKNIKSHLTQYTHSF